MIEARPAPPLATGFVPWLRKTFFSNWINSIISVVTCALIVHLGLGIFDWSISNAIWHVEDRELCGQSSGACWAVIEDRWRLIMFGLYPYEEQWRSALACFAIVITMFLTCIPFFWSLRRLATLWVTGFGIFVLLMRGGILGLSSVTSEQWGGLSLTIFIFSSVMITGMPLSVLLALARRSGMPVIARGTGMIIDVIRSLPLLTLLFAAAVVVPLLVPEWLEGNKLMRVIMAFSLFFAAYQSEIIRAGLQSIPRGQEEATVALGMPYWSLVLDILIPQAFRSSLPSTINQAVITFKETSIVTIIGFFEVMASGNAAIGNGDWGNQFVEVYVFLALIYFVFVFGFSRYGAWLEVHMRLGRG